MIVSAWKASGEERARACPQAQDREIAAAVAVGAGGYVFCCIQNIWDMLIISKWLPQIIFLGMSNEFMNLF